MPHMIAVIRYLINTYEIAGLYIQKMSYGPAIFCRTVFAAFQKLQPICFPASISFLHIGVYNCFPVCKKN